MRTLTIYLCALCATVSAQSFDASATGTVKGDYFVRQVLLSGLDQKTGAIGRARSLTGTITFDGTGAYTFKGQLMDSKSGTVQSHSTNGTYAVSANGLAQIQNPIDNTDTEFGAVGGAGPSAIVASATEGLYNDIFVAIPAGSGITSASFRGTYRTGFIDFAQADARQVRDGYLTLSPDSSGGMGAVSASGYIASQGSALLNQPLSGVTYSFTGTNGAGTLVIPPSVTPATALVSGTKTLYYSADGNLILGGSSNGFDIFVGVKTGTGTTAMSGTYFEAAIENDGSDLKNGNSAIDSFYGSINANGQGTAISHERVVTFDGSAYDYTTDDHYAVQADGTGTFDGYPLAANPGAGVAVVTGTGSYYSMAVLLAAKPVTPNGVYLNPYGIVNSASYAPITNSVAPGEYVTLFGSNLASVTLAAQAAPFQTTLGGVQVTVNGRPAPVYFVSPNQVSVLVPSATTEPYATFQVTNSGTASNKVTVYTNSSAPGVFSLGQNGVGAGAVEHADGSVVSDSSPAVAGETLVAYLTGLGAVTPPVADGDAASAKPLNTANGDTVVELQDGSGNLYSADVAFAGLSPGSVGLYQVNFTVPKTVPPGVMYVNVGTQEAYSTMTTIKVK